MARRLAKQFYYDNQETATYERCSGCPQSKASCHHGPEEERAPVVPLWEVFEVGGAPLLDHMLLIGCISGHVFTWFGGSRLLRSHCPPLEMILFPCDDVSDRWVPKANEAYQIQVAIPACNRASYAWAVGGSQISFERPWDAPRNATMAKEHHHICGVICRETTPGTSENHGHLGTYLGSD